MRRNFMRFDDDQIIAAKSISPFLSLNQQSDRKVISSYSISDYFTIWTELPLKILVSNEYENVSYFSHGKKI
jgi:hypothetical protein